MKKGIATIEQITKERRGSPRGDPKSPQKPETRVPIETDNFDRSVICQKIEHFYFQLRIMPIVIKLLATLYKRELICYTSKRSSDKFFT